MILTSLKLNQLSEEGFGWYRRYLTAMGSKSPDAVANLCDENFDGHVNNWLPIHGRQALRELLTGYFSGFDTLEHELLTILGSDSAFAVEMLIHYTMPDGAKVTMPAAHVIERTPEGLIRSARFYSESTVMTRALDGAREQAMRTGE